MTKPTAPVRPVAGFFTVDRKTFESLTCPESCLLIKLLSWCDPVSRQVKSSLRELGESADVPRMSVQRALERLVKKGHIQITKGSAQKDGMVIEVTCEACFPRKAKAPKKDWDRSGTIKVTADTMPEKNNLPACQQSWDRSGTVNEKTHYIELNTEEEKKEIQIQLSLQPTTEGKALVLAGAWLAFGLSKRKKLKGNTATFAKDIAKACSTVGCTVETLAWAFYLKREDLAFWHDKLYTPGTLLTDWQNGMKIEVLLDQCKSDKSIRQHVETMTYAAKVKAAGERVMRKMAAGE